jgi:hypothetical protein
MEWGATTARPDSLTMSGTATPEPVQISRMLKTTSRAYSSQRVVHRALEVRARAVVVDAQAAADIEVAHGEAHLVRAWQ